MFYCTENNVEGAGVILIATFYLPLIIFQTCNQ